MSLSQSTFSTACIIVRLIGSFLPSSPYLITQQIYSPQIAYFVWIDNFGVY